MSNKFEELSVNKVKKKNDLLLFFLLAYSIAWVSYLIEVLIQVNDLKIIIINDFNILLFLFQTITKYGPTIAGVIIALWLGKSVLKDLVARQTDLSKPKSYYLFSLLFPPFVMLIAIFITMILDSSVNITFVIPTVLTGLIYWLSLRFFFGGGLGEELGFRGFALSRLLVTKNPLQASFILGILWTFWHLPGWIITYDSVEGIIIRSIGQILVSFIVQFLFTVSLSFFFTLLFIKVKGNILTVSILHGSLNGFSAYFEHELFNLLNNDLWVILYVLAFVIVGLICVIYLRKENQMSNKLLIN